MIDISKKQFHRKDIDVISRDSFRKKYKDKNKGRSRK